MKTPDVMLKLVQGEGSKAEGACWMSAIHYYVGGEGWSDHPDCVCLVIRVMCYRLNDWLTDSSREELINPFLYEPVGTKQPQHVEARLDIAVAFAMEMALITAAHAAACADARAADAAADNAADNAADTAAYAAQAAAHAAAHTAADAATDAAAATCVDTVEYIKTRWLECILEMCAIGKEDREDIEQVRDLRDLVQVCR